MVVTSSERDRLLASVHQLEARDVPKHPRVQGQSPQQKIIWPQMSIVLRLRNPVLYYGVGWWGTLTTFQNSTGAIRRSNGVW